MTGKLFSRRGPARLFPSLLVFGAVGGLAACGAATGPEEYGTDRRTIEAEVGEEFTLSLPMQPSQGEWWYRVTPRPDEKVVRSEGDREDYEGSDLVGGGDGTQYFDFKAVGPGTTEIRVLHCPVGTCVGKGESASPRPGATSTNSDQAGRARYYTFTVSVRR
jgi:predicted secreted protein